MPIAVIGQSEIKNPGKKKARKCKKYFEVVKKLPPEVRYSVAIEDGEIIFYMGSDQAFNLLFDKRNDGLAIDVISRQQYDCTSGNQLANSWSHIGNLMEPVYRDELKRKLLVDEDHNVRINMGKLPSDYDPYEVECNLLVVQKRYLCSYHSFSHVEYNQWEMLKMGLYRDSLPMKEPEEFMLHKNLTFQVAFDKNEEKFDAQDLKPLYDSMRLTDYYIRSIDVEAFSSVEGDSVLNERLQHARALRIIAALQQLQDDDISFVISSSANWDEFYADIKGTSYEYLMLLTKKELKRELVKIAMEDSMEHILSQHRKAIIRLSLERKIQKHQPEEVVQLFGQVVKANKISEALYIQNYLFDEIKYNRLPEEYIGQLELPKIAEYNPLITNSIIYQYEHSVGDIDEHIEAFEQLLKQLPENPQIAYNLIALKLNAVNKYNFGSKKTELWNLIKSIERKMDRSLVTRLKVNYYILDAEYLHVIKKYREKNKALKQIYSNYRYLKLSAEDRLYLARFLSIYSQFKWAENLLAEGVQEDDVDPDVLDYYLRLTIGNGKKVRSATYQKLLKKAASEYHDVFCKLFLPKSQGGYTFQLLNNASLSEIYCESCERDN